MPDPDDGLVERWLSAVNEGIRSGSWTTIEDLLRDDAQMEFVGIPVGPFSGRAAIVDAYRRQPPDDVFLTLGAVRGQGAWRVATYAWGSRPLEPAGEVHLRAGSGGIERVRVLYGRFSDGELTDQPEIRSQPPM